MNTIYVFLISCQLWQCLLSSTNVVDMACSRDPSLPFCRRALGAMTHHGREPRQQAEVTEHDKMACRELRGEYMEKCNGKRGDEFCQAFENICFASERPMPSVGEKRIASELEEIDADDEQEKMNNKKKPEEESMDSSREETTAPTAKSRKKKVNFTKFCKEFKNRYLYICPDPFRFGQKAVLFCPIYSEHCHVPLPEKPVVPERKSRKRGNSVQRLCNSYRRFAETYCNNALLLAQPRYRAGCEKYWKFCLRRRP